MWSATVYGFRIYVCCVFCLVSPYVKNLVILSAICCNRDKITCPRRRYLPYISRYLMNWPEYNFKKRTLTRDVWISLFSRLSRTNRFVRTFYMLFIFVFLLHLIVFFSNFLFTIKIHD